MDIDILERLRGSTARAMRPASVSGMFRDAADEIERLRDFVRWVDAWVSYPVGAYSVSTLDGLFCMTRDRIAELEK